LAIAQDNLIHRRPPNGLVIEKACCGIGSTGKRVRQHARIYNALASRLRADRPHRMRGIAEQRYSAERPGR
jgi:hypothetical protein